MVVMSSRKPVGVLGVTRWKMSAVLVAISLGGLSAPPAQADEPGAFDERGGNIFFHEPDRDTAKRIDDLIGRFAEDSVRARTASRRELEDIGYWAVQPLMSALENEEPPIRAAAALTLSAILDPRTVDQLRASVERETSHPFVAGFAALGLARYRDAAAVAPLRAALRSSKSIHTLRAAAPLTLARIGTPEAQTLLMERLRSRVGNPHVKRARVLALGFFPAVALEANSPEPSAALRSGLRGKKRELRHAAVVAYLVATLRRTDTRDVLMGLLDREKQALVISPALLGLSRFEDSGTTAYLSHRAARSAEDDVVRELSCDLLVARNDATALPDLLSILRSTSSARLRASAVMVLGGIDDESASAAVLERFSAKSPLVRAAAAVTSVRMPQKAARDAALRRIESRLRAGDSSRDVRHNLVEARAVLSGERATAVWREVGAERLFHLLFRPYEERVLRAVNLAAEDALDLTKIQNLQTDSEVIGAGDSEGDGSGDVGSGDTGNGEGPGVPAGPNPPGGSPTPKDNQPAVNPPSGPKAPAVGSPRIATWQELRDLKVDLQRRPLFGVEDLQ